MKNTLMLAGYWGNALIYGLTYICDLRSDKPLHSPCTTQRCFHH